MSEQAPIPLTERSLIDVHNLITHYQENGEYQQWFIDDLLENYVTAVKEAGIPNAIHTAEHPYRWTGEHDDQGRPINAFMWLGRTVIQHAESGRRFHSHQSALERVDVEIDEAQYEQSVDVAKVFISPRMSESDAPYNVAKEENLADEDAVRITTVISDREGNVLKRRMQAALVRDIPLQAWVAFLADPNNPFKKSIKVENPNSALSVMKAHRQLEIPNGTLKEGLVSLIEAASAYIDDPISRLSVEQQVERFRESQIDIDTKARNVAKRWLAFDKELANSWRTGQATYAIERFIHSLGDKWTDEDLAIIRSHQQPGKPGFHMTPQLALLLAEAKQNILWTRAALITDNESVLQQFDAQSVAKLKRNEEEVQFAYDRGYEYQIQTIENRADRKIAQQNVKVGGGCSGSNRHKFRGNDEDSGTEGANQELSNSNRQEKWKTKKGTCVVRNCPTRPNRVRVGPCGVCMERCQKIYDEGKDPSRTSGRQTSGYKEKIPRTREVAQHIKSEALTKRRLREVAIGSAAVKSTHA